MSENIRQKEIYDILLKKKTATVRYLTEAVFSSEATIRRDLTIMEKKGLINRTHGGAVLVPSKNEETNIDLREETNKQEKRIIASLAAKFLKDNSSIFLDSSSTVASIIPFLNQYKNLTIITNGISTAMLISKETSFKVFLPSGFISSSSNSILGETSSNMLEKLYCDFFIFSTSGIDIDKGLTESSLEQAEIKNLMIKNSTIKILLVDSSKFNKFYLAKTCDLNKINILITEKEPPLLYKEYASQHKINIIFKK